MNQATEGDYGTHDPYSALRLRNFRFFLIGSVAANIGMQMQTVAVGWEIYERTGSAMALGWVGLVQVLPVIFLSLAAGHVADHHDRRRVMILTEALAVATSLGLAWLSVRRGGIHWMYALLLLGGIARAFHWPAKASFLPHIVPRERFSNAVTWNSGGFQLASVIGPALGGSLIWLCKVTWVVYIVDASATLSFVILLGLITHRSVAAASGGMTLRSLAAGIGFLRQTPIILATITLDMFAVLLGGATALLPIYAKDILHVGASGLGWMRAAPAIGALIMAFALAHRPPLRKAGRTLLWAVAGFGLTTVVFGVSRWFPLSLLMLFLTGALDNISVVVRHTLVQLLTPDEMRGRVSAINSVFIGASNELGGFESGLVAALATPTLSVVSGGVGTLIIVAAVAAIWPQIRRYGRLGDPAA